MRTAADLFMGPDVSLLLNPPTVAAESRVDDLVGLVRGVVEHRRALDCYGPLRISEDERDELANAVVANLLVDYDVTRRAL